MFHVDKAYWVGGFGDEHYIGWFSGEEWSASWKETGSSDQTLKASTTATEGKSDKDIWETAYSPLLFSVASDHEAENNVAHTVLRFQ